MGRHSDIEKIVKTVMEPMFEDIMAGRYKLEDLTMDIGTHRTVFSISLLPTMALRLDKNTKDPSMN